MFEDLADELAMASFDEGDNLHGPAALGAQQRVGLVDALNEHGPTLAVGGVGSCAADVGLWPIVIVLIGLFGSHAAGLVGVVAIVADEVFAMIGDVLGEFGEEVKGIEDLEIAGDAPKQVAAGGVGEAMGPVFLSVVNDLRGSSDTKQAGETERGAGHVLGEAFEAVAVAGGDADGAIDAEAGVRPRSDLADHGVIDAPRVEQESKDAVFPNAAERFVGEVDGDGVESAVGGECAVGDQAVDVGMEVHEGAEGLDGQDAAGGGVFAEQGAVGLEDGLPRETGELLEQVAVVAEEDAQAFGDGPDELAVRDVKADIFGDVHAEQEGAFLGATGADASLLAAKAHTV